jgi:uncharacterized membrane protein YcaP (DUF421 family)
MHALFSLNWHEILFPHVPWLEKILRPALSYLILLIIFRITSNRSLGQATMFDFLVILLISNVVQNAMIGDDLSLLGAAVGAITMVTLSALLNRITMQSRKVRHLLEGSPTLLIHNGVQDEERMRRLAISRSDLNLAVRKAGLTRLADVGFAILELDGSISIIRTSDDKRPHDCLPIEVVGSESDESKDCS